MVATSFFAEQALILSPQAAFIGWDPTSPIASFWLAVVNPLSPDSSMAEPLVYNLLLALIALPNFHSKVFQC